MPFRTVPNVSSKARRHYIVGRRPLSGGNMGKRREWKYVASLATALLLVCAAAAQTNIASEGQGYYWYGMKTSTATTNQTATTIINDGNLTNTLNCDVAGETSTNRYEGAGVIFSSAQSNITSLSFINGPLDSNGNGK